MLTILGQPNRFCDGISRRGFLKIGALGVGTSSLTLADIFRAEARAGSGSSHKAVINIFLGGGPPHQDMWDIKTEAPAEIRGEFKPIATNVPGIQIGEVFPRIAASMDKCAVIRSVVGASGGHDALQCTTGWPKNSLVRIGRPAQHRRRGRPGCKARSIPRCRRSSAWPQRTQHVPWSRSGPHRLPRLRLRRLQARTARAWPT